VSSTALKPKQRSLMEKLEDLIDWNRKTIWNPYGKTEKARRFVPRSERMAAALSIRCGTVKGVGSSLPIGRRRGMSIALPWVLAL